MDYNTIIKSKLAWVTLRKKKLRGFDKVNIKIKIKIVIKLLRNLAKINLDSSKIIKIQRLIRNSFKN